MTARPTGAPDLPRGAIIFDCDGVLIDSEPLSAAVLADVLTEAGHPATAFEIHTRFSGLAAVDMISAMRAEDGIHEPERFLEASRAALFPRFARELEAVAGIEALVSALDRPYCVASNSGIERLDRSLGLLPIRALFGPHVYSAEMVPRPKPAPDLVELCLERLGVAARDAVMIDDNPPGIEAARAAGVVPIGFVTPGETRPAREAVLREAGAVAVATSAEQLAHLLGVAPVAVA
ncbi:HAD family hydrolase [Acuticoccus sediminis]|uniref:HAD family hydrolase n=1 Tax=Acuticoccus sediminis TaxID=2184697 RepID=UPI001CFD08AA|nr:HAD-IA family hydrolase [Acuticoccus sediminis]